MVDHETIWLEAKCREDGNNGREWCQDDVWGDDCGCDEGGHKPTKYIRADLATPAVPATQEAVERVAAVMAAEIRRITGYVLSATTVRVVAEAALAASGHATAKGFVLVPVEPTEAMCRQADSNWSGFCSDTPGAARKAAARLYRAMISAASGHGNGGGK